MSSTRPVSKMVIAPPGPLGIKVRPIFESGGGLIILTVDPKSPLLGKLYPGDWIVSMDGQDVSSVSDLASRKDEGRLLGVLTAQDQQRRQQQQKIQASQQPQQLSNIAAVAAMGPPVNLLEYTVEPVGVPLGLLLDDKHVVVQVCPGSPMEGKLRERDKIYAVNGVGVSSLDMTQLASYLSMLQDSYELVTLQIERYSRNESRRRASTPKTLRGYTQHQQQSESAPSAKTITKANLKKISAAEVSRMTPSHVAAAPLTNSPAIMAAKTGTTIKSPISAVTTSLDNAITSTLNTLMTNLKSAQPVKKPLAMGNEQESQLSKKKEDDRRVLGTVPGEARLHDFLSPAQGLKKNSKIPQSQRRDFPVLTAYNISISNDEESKKSREKLLSELILWNETHGVDHEFVSSLSTAAHTNVSPHLPQRFRLIRVPAGEQSSISGAISDDTSPKDVLEACRKSSSLFDEVIMSLIAKYFGLSSSDDKPLEVLLTYLAHEHSKMYEKFSKVAHQLRQEQPQTLLESKAQARKRQAATVKEQQKTKQFRRENADVSGERYLMPRIENDTGQQEQQQCGGAPQPHKPQPDDVSKGEANSSANGELDSVTLPEDYHDYDGTGDTRWNLRYMDLMRYCQLHGHCMVTTREVPLGKWVAWQRESYRKNYAALTPRRKELLDSLGFVWEAKHANRKPHVETGDPRLNKALATRIVFESNQLSDRQIFILSGFSKAEMEEVRNPTHAWRNGLVVLRKRLDARLKAFLARTKKEEEGAHNLPRRKSYSAVQELITTLKDTTQPDRYVQVYGEENAKLLEGFLSGAVEEEQAVSSNNSSSVTTLNSTGDSQDIKEELTCMEEDLGEEVFEEEEEQASPDPKSPPPPNSISKGKIVSDSTSSNDEKNPTNQVDASTDKSIKEPSIAIAPMPSSNADSSSRAINGKVIHSSSNSFKAGNVVDTKEQETCEGKQLPPRIMVKRSSLAPESEVSTSLQEEGATI